VNYLKSNLAYYTGIISIIKSKYDIFAHSGSSV